MEKPMTPEAFQTLLDAAGAYVSALGLPWNYGRGAAAQTLKKHHF
jgi:hypothetical protein